MTFVDEEVDPPIAQIFTDGIDPEIEVICGNLRNLWMKFSCLSFLSWLLSFRMHRGEPRKRRRTRNGFASGRGPGWVQFVAPNHPASHSRPPADCAQSLKVAEWTGTTLK